MIYFEKGLSPSCTFDNGNSFTANSTREFIANCYIQWKVSITEGPSYGGFWESLICHVKRYLKKNLAKSLSEFL